MQETHTHDRFYHDKILIKQPKKGFRVSIDALLLAAACPVQPGEAMADFGTASGIAALAVLTRCPDVTGLLIDREAAMVQLAETNCALNGMEARTLCLEADVTARGHMRQSAGLAENCVDHIIANPPYYEEGAVRNTMHATHAHIMAPGDLLAWVKTAAAMLRGKGTLTMIHRAEALPAMLAAFDGRFGRQRILPIHPFAHAPASRVLIQAALGRKTPPSLLPPLVLHEEVGGYRQDVTECLNGDADLLDRLAAEKV